MLLTLNTLLEIITGISALLSQVAYLHFIRKISVRTATVVAMLTIPALFMSLESMNSFLTCDESYLVYEPVDLAHNPLLMWKMGAFRTTNLLVGVPLAGVKYLTGFSMDILAVFGKSLHWFLSFLLIMVIVELVLRLSELPEKFPVAYLATWYSISVFPVVLLAQKILNYDAFAMLFGALAILLLAVGWKEKRQFYLYMSIVVAAFAAQEKLIASPLVWICLCIVPLRISFQNGYDSLWVLVQRTIKAAILAAMAAFMVFFVTSAIVDIVNVQGAPGKNAFNLFYPLVSGFWPLLRMMAGDVTIHVSNPLFEHWYFVPFFAAVVIIFLAVVTTTGTAVCRLAYSMKTALCIGDRISMNLRFINYLLLFCLYALGIAGTYLINAFLAPYYPVTPGAYQGSTFNRAFVYFGATSLPAHLAYSVGWAYAVAANALPTAFLGCAAINTLSFMKKRRVPNLLFELVFTGALVAPLIYGLLQLPVGNRYLNLFLLIIILKLLYDLLSTVHDGIRLKTIALALCIALIAEVYPFRPLFASFRPIWSNFSFDYNTSPSKAVLNPWWMGWGEEVCIAGQRLQTRLKRDNPSLDGVTIYSNYMGEWLLRKNNARIVPLDTIDRIGYSRNDFYVLNRMGIAQSSLNFPEHVTPYETISFRGFVQAWVFRGSDLAEQGFRFRDTSGVATRQDSCGTRIEHGAK
jgi:hypothetical protein